MMWLPWLTAFPLPVAEHGRETPHALLLEVCANPLRWLNRGESVEHDRLVALVGYAVVDPIPIGAITFSAWVTAVVEGDDVIIDLEDFLIGQVRRKREIEAPSSAPNTGSFSHWCAMRSTPLAPRKRSAQSCHTRGNNRPSAQTAKAIGDTKLFVGREEIGI